MNLRQLYVYARYENAVFWLVMQLLATAIVLIFGAWLFLQSALADAMGLNKLQERSAALQSAVYWEFRAWKYADLPRQEFTRHYGFINSGLPDGRLLITIAEGDKYTLKEVSLANLTHLQVDGLAAAAAMRKQASATFDMYPNDRAVVWIAKKPWNVALITDGLAKPSNNPLTNVVDLVFAEYFWGIFKGDSK